MTIIFDLDHTLFDTKAFVRDLHSRLKLSGYSPSTIKKSFALAKQPNGNYSFPKHLAALKKLRAKTSPAKKVFQSFSQTSWSGYLKPGTLATLKQLRHQGRHLIILTKGDKGLQRLKIRRTGLNKLFHKIIICSVGTKLTALAKLNPGHDTYLINDHWGEIQLFKKRSQKIHYVLFVRPDHKSFYRLSGVGVSTLKTLPELDKIIAKAKPA